VPLLILSVVFALALAGLGYGLRAKIAGRCSQCGGGFVAGTSLRSCVGGHKIHQTCVKFAMEREVCPICGIYVSESPARVKSYLIGSTPRLDHARARGRS
jgi:hypothetical protein